MKVYIHYEDTGYDYEVPLRTILRILGVDLTQEQIETAAKQAVVES